MRAPALTLALVLAAAPAAARASDLEVAVHGGRGAPVVDAVVTVTPAVRTAAPARFDQPLVLTQRQLQFSPFVLVVPVGSEVRFPNEDKVRHQVYSFSPAKSFELRLYGAEQSRVVRFDKPGVVSVGCNIHDQMVAFIDVVDAPFAVRTDAAGRAVLRGLPAGAAVVRVWHPYAKGRGGAQQFDVTLPRDGTLRREVVAEVRAPPMTMPAS